MEIIPILSTIILVATIATFILAIAAYVLYKIRERRARQGGTIRTDVVMDNHGHMIASPQQPMLGQGYAPAGYPQMQAGPTLALPAPVPQLSAMPGMPGMASQGRPLAVDTDADGRYDTVYEPRPTYQDPMTGAPTAYQPAPDMGQRQSMGMQGMQAMPGMPGMPGIAALPGMVAAQPMTPVGPALGAPAQARGSMFYEVTQQGLVPTPGAATAATEQERARLGAIQREQDRLEQAEDASKDRLDHLRRQQDSPAWL